MIALTQNQTHTVYLYDVYDLHELSLGHDCQTRLRPVPRTVDVERAARVSGSRAAYVIAALQFARPSCAVEATLRGCVDAACCIIYMCCF